MASDPSSSTDSDIAEQRPAGAGADQHGARRASTGDFFADSPYFAFSIGAAGELLTVNAHTVAALGPVPPAARAEALYAIWSQPMLRDEALPTARARGYWRGELELIGAAGVPHMVTQTIEWRAASACYLCLAYPLDDYDVFESRLRFKHLFEAHPQPMWVYDLETLRFLVVNAAAIAHYGYTEAEFLRMTIKDIRPPEELERLALNLADAPSKGADRSTDWTHIRRDGGRIQVEISSHAVTIAGRPARFVMAHDVTEQLRLSAELHASRELKQLVINHVPQQIFWKGLDGAYLGGNAVFIQSAGLTSSAELVGKRDEQLPWAQIADVIRAEEQSILTTGRPRLASEKQSTQPDGSVRWYNVNKLPFHDQHGDIIGVLGTIEDITDRKHYQAQLEHQASHDALTGLPNRALMGDRLEQAIGYAERYGHSVWVAFIDLDNFKLVNDSEGHLYGDALLCSIAARLRACLHDSDTVARIGGDEFLLLLPDADGRPIAGVLQRVLEAIGAPVTLAGQLFTVTASIGVSVYPADGVEPQPLLKHADIAMYRAKEAGRNQIQFYESAMHSRIAERTMIEAELRHALARNQLSLHYQPKLDLRSGAVIGMEALLRWQHPTLGMVSPTRFIGVAEETGLIVPIGRWVLRTACAQNMAWQRAGLAPLRVAVNLSARQFRDPALAGEVVAALADSGLAPQYLELELTESLMMHNVEAAVVAVAQLKQLGIALSIDDFGTGYSSLAYLKQFPVDCLKIDQSFTREMLAEPKVAAIVRSVIALGHSLGFTVIAEGVETEDELAYLRGAGCDEMQGYLFSRPLPPEAFADLLRTDRRLAAPA